VATTLVDTILADADARINYGGNAILLMNKKLADALHADVKRTYGTIMPWERVFDGFEIAKYDGVTVASVATWDFMINKYFNTGTAWENPFRAVMYNPENLIIGPDANDPISELDIWFNKDERTQKVYATGKLDTMVGLDEHVHLAY
jgi:hypothetical protein